MSTPITDPVLEPWKFAPDPLSAFGPIVSAFEIEHALAACVRRWQRDYLAEVCRQRGLGPEQLPPYRSIVVSGSLEKFPEDQTPALVVASPGLAPGAGQLSRRGDGAVGARFALELGSFISARGNRQAHKVARLYTAAVVTLCVQQALEPSPALAIVSVDPTGVRFNDAQRSGERTVALGVAALSIEIAEVFNRRSGPLEPTLPPTGPDKPPEPMEDPEVLSTHVTVTQQEEE